MDVVIISQEVLAQTCKTLSDEFFWHIPHDLIELFVSLKLVRAWHAFYSLLE